MSWIHVSVHLWTMKISQWVCKNFCSYRKKTILQLSAWWFGLWIAVRLEVVSFAAAGTGVTQHSSSQATAQEVALLGYRPLCFCQVSIRTTWFTQHKQRGQCIKTRSPPALLPFEGRVTEQTTVKKGSVVIHTQIKIINLTKMNIFWN